jgi:hypothetical protein
MKRRIYSRRFPQKKMEDSWSKMGRTFSPNMERETVPPSWQVGPLADEQYSLPVHHQEISNNF